MKEEINFSPKVVIFEDGGSLAPNIPSPYKFNGTKIFRDTTALPFLNGGPLVEKTNHGKLLNSIYASDLGPYHYDSGGPIKSQNGFIPYKRYDLFDNSLKNGGQFSGSYSLPEDSFRQGGNNLHNSVYASSAGQYPAIYAAGGIMPDPGDITCPDGYTYNPETHDCEKASTTCPEGYQYNPNTGECDSLTKEWQMKLLGAPAKYNIDNTGDKYKVTDPDKYIDSEMTELTPEQLRTVQEETDGKNAKAATNVWPKDFKIKQMVDPLYIAESGTHTITNPNYVNSQESQNWYNHATFPKIPDLNYKVVIDPTKTEGYNKEENIYYVNSENTHQAKKYKEWQILKDLETKSLEDAKKYGFTINSKDNETKLIQQLYNNPEYLGDTASNTSYEELFKDRAKKEEEHWKKICPDCTYKHGINYSVDPNYIYRTLDPTNLVGPEDYFTKILTTEKVDHTKPDKERIKGSMEMYENPDAPFYSPSDYDRRMPTLNIHDGKTRALKPDWLRDMQIGNNHYNRQRYYNFPKLEIGSREATKLIPKIVQKITGYDKDFMEGTTDDEGNYIPGEIDKAEQENRLINFKGASSIKDLINQKNYNEQSKNYKEELNTVRELNKNLLLEHGWDASSYKYGGGMSFANGGPSCPEGTQWDNDLKTCVKIGLNTLPQVNVSPWAVDMKAEQPTQVSNVLQNLIKKNESNSFNLGNLGYDSLNHGPSDAIQSSDWMWQLPIAGKGIGQGIKALGELGGMAIPGLAGTTLGNAATAGFAGHGLTNLAMNSPKEWYDVSQGKGDWKEAALNTALHASELMGSGIGKGALNLVGKTGNALKTGYNTVATGNSIIPYAWKSPAVGLSQEKSAAMFDQILNSSKFTDADKALIKEYTYSSTPFTRSGPKQNKFNDLIQRVNTEFPDNAVVTRRFYDDPEMSNFAFESIKGEPGKIKEFSIENRPSSFSTGAGTGNYGKDRIVLSGKNLKKVEDNFVKNTYEGVPEEYYANLPEENLIVKDRSKEIAENSSRIGDNYYGTSRLTPEEIKAQAEALYEQKFANYGNPADREEAIKKIIEEGKTSFSGNSSTSKERELMASGFNMKTLGKVKNDIGGFDYIVKPKLQGSSFMDSAVGAAKALTEPVVNYGKDVIGASKAAGKFTLPTYANTYRAEHAGFNIPAVENSLTGRWFANNPEDARFYTSNLKDPITGEVIRNNTAPVRVMKSRLPQHTINENFGINMPEDARIMSMGRGELTNEELVKYLGPGADRRFRNQVFTQGDLNSMQTHPYLFNKSEGILSPRIVNDARSKGIVFENQEGAFQHLNNEEIKIKQNNSLKKYLPFRNGGELSHFYDSNIQAYNNGGNLYDNVLVFKKKI